MKVAVAFGGGAVLGAAHVGVLKALIEHGFDIQAVSGTSIGSMIASLYAFDHNPEKVEELAIELSWKDITTFSFSKYGLLSNDSLGSWVKEHIGDVQIEDASIPLHIVATDIENGEKLFLNKGSLATAIQASTCIPGLFRPVEWEGKMLVDGGIVENVPISPLSKSEDLKIIAIDLNAKQQYAKPSNVVDVLVNSFHFTLATRAVMQAEKADILISPDLSAFNRYDPKQSKALIKKGYETAIEALKDL